MVGSSHVLAPVHTLAQFANESYLTRFGSNPYLLQHHRSVLAVLNALCIADWISKAMQKSTRSIIALKRLLVRHCSRQKVHSSVTVVRHCSKSLYKWKLNTAEMKMKCFYRHQNNHQIFTVARENWFKQFYEEKKQATSSCNNGQKSHFCAFDAIKWMMMMMLDWVIENVQRKLLYDANDDTEIEWRQKPTIRKLVTQSSDPSLFVFHSLSFGLYVFLCVFRLFLSFSVPFATHKNFS